MKVFLDGDRTIISRGESVRILGSQRLRKSFARKIVIITLLPLSFFIAFDVLDLDGSDSKPICRNGLFFAEPEQDNSGDNNRGKVLTDLPDEAVWISIANIAPGGLSPRAREHAIRAIRVLARRDMSESHTHTGQSTDPA